MLFIQQVDISSYNSVCGAASAATGWGVWSILLLTVIAVMFY